MEPCIWQPIFPVLKHNEGVGGRNYLYERLKLFVNKHFHQGRRSNSKAIGPTGTKGPHSANIYYPLSQSCIAYIARYWL